MEPGNRDVFEQTRDTRVPPSLYHPSLFSRAVEHRRCLYFRPLPPTRSRFSLSRSHAFPSPSSPSLYRFTMVDDALPPLRRLPPSPPDPSSWGGLKCHSFSSCARFHAPKESVFPFPSFFLSIFSLLLSSHTPSLPRSALAFVDRVILAPGRRQNRGEMGRAIFGFLLCWKW